MARAWGVPPTEYLERWSARDRGLAESLFLYERSYCQCGCGQLRRLAHDSDTAGGHWIVDHVTCFAREALEEDAAGAEKDEPGTIRVVHLSPDYVPKPLPPAPPA